MKSYIRLLKLKNLENPITFNELRTLSAIWHCESHIIPKGKTFITTKAIHTTLKKLAKYLSRDVKNPNRKSVKKWIDSLIKKNLVKIVINSSNEQNWRTNIPKENIVYQSNVNNYENANERISTLTIYRPTANLNWTDMAVFSICQIKTGKKICRKYISRATGLCHKSISHSLTKLEKSRMIKYTRIGGTGGGIIVDATGGIGAIKDKKNIQGGKRIKLSEDIVKKIQEKYATGEFKQKELSKLFSVDKATISRIIKLGGVSNNSLMVSNNSLLHMSNNSPKGEQQLPLICISILIPNNVVINGTSSHDLSDERKDERRGEASPTKLCPIEKEQPTEYNTGMTPVKTEKESTTDNQTDATLCPIENIENIEAEILILEGQVRQINGPSPEYLKRQNNQMYNKFPTEVIQELYRDRLKVVLEADKKNKVMPPRPSAADNRLELNEQSLVDMATELLETLKI
jgi:DNA-binding MarR family transcriptional regulator